MEAEESENEVLRHLKKMNLEEYWKFFAEVPDLQTFCRKFPTEESLERLGILQDNHRLLLFNSLQQLFPPSHLTSLPPSQQPAAMLQILLQNDDQQILSLLRELHSTCDRYENFAALVPHWEEKTKLSEELAKRSQTFFSSPDIFFYHLSAIRIIARAHTNISTFHKCGITALTIKTLTTYPDDIALLSIAYSVLTNFSFFSPAEEIIVQNCPGLAIAAIERFWDFPTLHSPILTMLSNLASNNCEFAMNIFSQFNLFLHLMTHYKTDVDIQSPSCYLFHSFASHKEFRSIMAASGAIEAIVNALTHSPKNDHVIHRACVALRTMCQSEKDYSKKAIATGAFPLLIQAIKMRELSSQFNPQLSAYRVVHLWLRQEVLSCSADVESGVDAILQLIKNHPKDTKIQHEVWSTFDQLTGQKWSLVISKAGGMDVTLNALKLLADDPKLIAYCCARIWELCNYADTGDNRDIAIEKDAAHLICEAMKSHPTEINLQAKGCGALWALSTTGSCSMMLIKAGAVECVMQAMRVCDGDELVNGCACGLIQDVSNYETYDLVRKSGGIEAVMSAMKKFPEDWKIQNVGSGALRNLSFSSRNRQQMMKSNTTAELIIHAMKTEGSEAKFAVETLEHCAWVVRNLSQTTEWRRVMAESGIIVEMCDALRKYPLEKVMQSIMFSALWKLSMDAANVQLIQIEGGIDLAVEALRHHPNEEQVQQIGLKILTKLFNHESPPICETQKDFVERAIQTFPNNRKISSRGKQLLSTS